MPFRLQANRVFLTYPQATCSKQALFDFLSTLTSAGDGQGIPVARCLVAQEAHEDGGIHFHCYVEFNRKVDVRNERLFDFEENHPNIQKVRSKQNVIDYCTKDDQEPLANFSWREVSITFLDKLRAGIAEGKSVNDILDDALNEDPKAIRFYSNAAAYVNARKAPSRVFVPKYDLASFSLSGPDRARIDAFVHAVQTPRGGARGDLRGMWLVGPSRYGKTSLARSIANHWYMQSAWSVDNLDDSEGVYGVLDDLAWRGGLDRSYKALLGAQEDITLTDKYRAKKTFKYGHLVIVCTNELPDFTDEEKSWLRVNIDFYRVVVPLFNNPHPIAFEVIHL